MDRLHRIAAAPWFFVRTLYFWHRRYPRDSGATCVRIAWTITTAMCSDED